MSWKLFSHDMSLSPEIYFPTCVEWLSKLVDGVLIEIIEKKLRQYKWNSAETVSQNCFSKSLLSPCITLTVENEWVRFGSRLMMSGEFSISLADATILLKFTHWFSLTS